MARTSRQRACSHSQFRRNAMSVSINTDPFFNEATHTQGNMPHLLQYLFDKYVGHLQRLIAERSETHKNEDVISIEEVIKKIPAVNFVKFASNFLKEHRVVENFFCDSNHGLRLSNN